MGMIQEFKDFLKEYKVVGLAVAFIMGAATTTLVQSVVNDIIMPIITPVIPNGGWEEATLELGPVVIKWGSFLGALINFLMMALVVFILIKILKKAKVSK
jgi:large conductance mechanosensitive channel